MKKAQLITGLAVVAVAGVLTAYSIWKGGSKRADAFRPSGPPVTTGPVKYRPSRHARKTGAVRLLGRKAPELRVARWTKGNTAPPSIRGSRGKVVVIFAFQSW